MLELKKGSRKGPRYNTGPVATMLYRNLLRDFRASEGNTFFAGMEDKLMRDITEFRSTPERELGNISVGRFKRTKQMEAILKKFRFSTDAYTDVELSEKTRKAFILDQTRLHNPLPINMLGKMVLQRARLIARRILGEFPGDEVINEVRFGRKSSIGCPLSLAYLDIKLSKQGAFTGTAATVEHFVNQVLPGDQILQRILKNHTIDLANPALQYTHLNLVEVPKTWKTYRLITPLTLIGLFYSYGIGRVVSVRLKDAGLNISKLQSVHQELVEEFSLTRSHATADLSAASDSITSELLNRILPRAWYQALKKTFVRTLKIGDDMYSTASVLPMGNGATFPVETLVFYCIIKAIGELSKMNGIYSVYGDDLIYPSRLHKFVTVIFPQLHLKLNQDKTYVSYPFRESCGADFYRGQDVRPFFLKGDAEYLTRVRYEAFLYKVYNGLTARWDPREIPGTLTWLLSELAMVSKNILRVPPHLPDYSGIKVEHPLAVPLDCNFLNFEPIFIHINHGTRWFQFKHLIETPKKRIVETIEPYYWLSLQGITDEVVDEYGALHSCDKRYHSTIHWKNVFKCKGDVHDLLAKLSAKRSSLSWKSITRSPVIFIHKGRKVVKKRKTWKAVVDSRVGATVSTATTSNNPASIVTDWC